MKALLLNHLMFVKKTQAKLLPSDARKLCDEIVTFDKVKEVEIAGTSLFRAPKALDIEIDRIASERLVVGQSNNPKDSLIAQVAAFFCGREPNEFQGKLPWKSVWFKGEGAPRDSKPETIRALVATTARSIFLESSQLTVSRGKFFIPFARQSSGFDPMYVYRGIGVLIGIIIRTGWSQPLPFAPFVWRYLCNGRLKPDDIFEADPDLAAHVGNLRQGLAAAEWRVADWDGTAVELRGRAGEVADNVEEYVCLYVYHRMSSIVELLARMREGLMWNLGWDESQVTRVFGAGLARLAEGDSAGSFAAP